MRALNGISIGFRSDRVLRQVAQRSAHRFDRFPNASDLGSDKQHDAGIAAMADVADREDRFTVPVLILDEVDRMSDAGELTDAGLTIGDDERIEQH